MCGQERYEGVTNARASNRITARGRRKVPTMSQALF